MHPSVIVILSLAFTLSSSHAAPHQYVEITRPLPSDSLRPSCTLPLFSRKFGNTVGLPPTHVRYSPPINCVWSRAAVHISAASSAAQKNRIAAVWIDGVEILRNSTPDPTAGDVFWNIRKDISKYSSLLRKPHRTVAVMLPNTVNAVFNGVYELNLTFLYYDVGRKASTINAVNMPLPLLPETRRSNIENLKLGRRSSGGNYFLDSNKKPADLIIPVSDIGAEGFWFKIDKCSDIKRKGIRVPVNTYRAVIEVYLSFHGNDEFWYSNPPDSYLKHNNLTSQRGNGAYREVFVRIDDAVVGSAIPFPVVFAGGINPLYWDPVVSIGAFDLPSYEIELTPFLGMILDRKSHSFGLEVSDALSFWLVNANLHLWLDDKAPVVKAATSKYAVPSGKAKRKTKIKNLDGKFKIKVKRKTEFSGWVCSSFGNLTTKVSQKLKFKSKIKYKESGTEKQVKQTVNLKTEVEVESSAGTSITSASVDKKYSLELTTSVIEEGKNNHTTVSKLENSMEEERSNGSFTSSLDNSQTLHGTMYALDRVVLYGAATTDQKYAVSDEFGCYSRKVSAAGGRIKNDTTNVLCASAS